MLCGQKSRRMVEVGRNIQRSPCPALTAQAGSPRARWLLTDYEDRIRDLRGQPHARKWFVMFRENPLGNPLSLQLYLWRPWKEPGSTFIAPSLGVVSFCIYWKIKDPPKLSPLQAKLSQLSQPLLTGEHLHSLHHPCGSWLHLLQDIHISPVLRSQDWRKTSRRGFSSAEPRGRSPSWSSWQ